MANRKYIRIALTPEDEVAFLAAKAKVEDANKIIMTDASFALSLIRWALQK
jgi:hypothetical protein